MRWRCGSWEQWHPAAVCSASTRGQDRAGQDSAPVAPDPVLQPLLEPGHVCAAWPTARWPATAASCSTARGPRWAPRSTWRRAALTSRPSTPGRSWRAPGPVPLGTAHGPLVPEQATGRSTHPSTLAARSGKPRLPCMPCGLLVRAPRGGSKHERLPAASTPCCGARVSAASSALTAMPACALAQAHGVLMVVAWVFLLPISVAVARTCKGHDPLWFQAHRALGVRPACPARSQRPCCAHCTASPRPALPTLRVKQAARAPRAGRGCGERWP